MHRFSRFILLGSLYLGILFNLIGCGTDENKNNLTAEKAPQTESSPTPSIPSGSTLKWTPSEIDESTTSCANRGSERYQTNRWEVFCRCAYTAAAQKWTYQEFFANFNQNYETLYQAQTIQHCLKEAGLTN